MSAWPLPTGPGEFDSVQIIDRLTGTRVRATVESAHDPSFVLHLEHEVAMPEEAFLRWFDGADAWQAIAQVRRIGEARIRCELAPSDEWQAAPARRSTRVRLEDSPVFVKILPGERRVHATGVDISDTGCRTTWLGKTPSVGDAVAITWDVEPARSAPPTWIPARVVRILPRPFGAHHVCFSFQFATQEQADLVRARHEASLEVIRQRRRNDSAA